MIPDLMLVVKEALFGQKIEELKVVYRNLKWLEALIAEKSFFIIYEKELNKAHVVLLKELVFGFIEKLENEISPEEILVLKKISESGWNGISNYELIKSFRGTELNNAGELDKVIENMTKKDFLYRKEEYTMITEKGKDFLSYIREEAHD